MSIYDEMLDDPSMIPDTETVNPNPPNPEDFQEQGETGDLQPIGPNTQATEQLETPTDAHIVQPQVLPDLTNPEVKQQMKDDQSIWWDMPRGEEKAAARKQWIEKYWGSEKKYNDQFSLYGSSNPIEVVGDTMKSLAAFGEGGIAYVSDLIGLLPGLAGVDNAYDRYTAEMYDNELLSAVRNVSKIVIPSIISGNIITGLTNKAAAAGMIGRLQQFGIGLGLNTVVDSAIVSLADQSSDTNHFQWAYDENFLNLFGRDQLLEIPDIFLKGDKYSPYLNRFSAAMADLPFSFIGNLIGWSIAMKANPKGSVMGWYEPLDETAVSYKNSRILSVADTENIKEMDRLQTVLQSGTLSKVDEAEAIDRLILLEESTGKLDDIDNALRIDEELINSEKNLSGIRKIAENGGEVPTNKIDGDISPDLVNSGKVTPTPGNVARNQADLAAIRQGDSIGDPAAIDTELAKQGISTDMPSRDTVVNVSKVDTGNFNAVVDGFNFNQKQMRAAAWGYYADIVDPDGTVDDIITLFNTKKDTKSLLSGKLQVEYIPDDKFHAAMLAVRDLMDIFSGRQVNETSARVMASLGFDIRTAAESTFKYKGLADFDAGIDRMLDKIEFLLDETDLSKYVAGWQLKNKDWMASVPLENLEQAATDVLSQFGNQAKSITAKNRKFVQTLRRAKEYQPDALRALTAAFVQTEGDVDTMTKLIKFASREVNPLTVLKSPNPREMTLFSKSLFSVVFNNVLSAGSVVKATVAGQAIQAANAMTSMPGHIFWGLMDGDLLPQVQKSLFLYHDSIRVYKKALGYAWKQMLKTHQDPTTMIRNSRKDFVFKNFKAQEVVDDVRKGVWDPDQNFGKQWQHNVQKALFELGQNRWARYPMTGMAFPDAFSKMVMAHKWSRFHAYLDTIEEFGWADPKRLRKAEIKYRRSFFKGDELVDSWVGKQADDINFTADDGLSNIINQGTTAYPLLRFAFMFPRTESNSFKYAASWVPITRIPGTDKISKTLYANSDDSIREALKGHGVDFDLTPHAREIWKELRAEYTGRLIWGTFITKLGWDYAMNGGITGSGHWDAATRIREQKELGYKYKTARIPGTDIRVSFEGIPIIDPLFTILGNMVQYAKDIDEPLYEDLQAKIAWTLISGFGDNKLETLGFLSDLLLFEKRSVERFFKRAATATFIPAEVRQLTKAIDDSLKAVNDDLMNFIKAQNPITIGSVPTYRTIATGLPVRDTNNGWLRWQNAFSGVKFSEDNLDSPDRDDPFTLTFPNGETWTGTTIDALRELIQYPFSEIETSSKGNIKYSEAQVEQLILAMHSIGNYGKNGKGKGIEDGSEFFWKLRRIVTSKKYQKELGLFRAATVERASKDTPDLKLRVKDTQMYDEIRKLVKEYKGIAETTINLNNLIEAQREINYNVGEGNINEAEKIRQRNTGKQELLQYGGSR
tara:strand:+ start:1242 stop:5543 length:4302 start_codon:yes stop_codon:yes gene_type:complete